MLKETIVRDSFRRFAAMVLALSMAFSLLTPVAVALDGSDMEICTCAARCTKARKNANCALCAEDWTRCGEVLSSQSGDGQGTDSGINSTSIDNAAWECDVYYTNEADRYHVEENQKFSVKYQVSFSNSENLEPFAVTIRIPAALQDEDGNNIARDEENNILEPYQYGIPTREKAVSGEVTGQTSFCWEIVEIDGVRYVEYTNFRTIVAGSNNNWEVGYRSGSAMTLRDGSTWELTPEVTVHRHNGQTDTGTLRPLTGEIDTAIKLSNVTKKPYVINGKNYAPGLYTPKQVSNFAGMYWYKGFLDIYPQGSRSEEEYQKELLKHYYFVAWQVTADVTASQAFDLYMTENVCHSYNGQEINGRVVSAKLSFNNSTNNHDDITDADGWKVLEKCQDEYFDGVFTVVVAYPAEELAKLGDNWDDKVYNEVKFTAVPFDGVDDPQVSAAESDWIYSDYAWTYHGEITLEKGDDIRHNGWTTEYDYKNHNVASEHIGGIRFTTSSSVNGYRETHYTDSERLGEYKPDTWYTLETVDETMYASPNPVFVNEEKKLLTKEDYYFSGVSVSRTDVGYDPWEDLVLTEEPEKTEDTGVDYTTAIYAKFAKDEHGNRDDSDNWVPVTTLVNEWVGTSGNRMYYNFTYDDLKKEPYAVKVVQTSTNYRTDCSISVNVMIRADSPVFGDPMTGYSFSKEGEDRYVTVRDESHISSRASDDSWIVADKADIGDSWLYPVLRGAEMKKVQKSAGSDENTHTAYIRYNITEFDGYFVDNASGITKLRNMGITSPGKSTVVFYDLLPYGMSFDPSMEVIAGRVPNTYYGTEVGQEKGWNRNNVIVAPEVVSPDYNGTGRQLVKFTLTYTGDDASALISRYVSPGEFENMWAESWGVSFGAHYSWADADLVKNAMNLSAFMLGNNDEHIIGNYVNEDGDHGTIYYDDGESQLPDYNGLPVRNLFTEDLDGDGETDGDEIMFAFCADSDELVTSSESSITKAVRADEDPFTPFSSEAVVTPGLTYTYDINVKTANESLKHITIFDNMEIASYIRRLASGDGSAADESYYSFEDTFWHGTFVDIITTSLDQQCPGYLIYYHDKREAVKPESGKQVADMAAMCALLEHNGWKRDTIFKEDNGEDWREHVGAIAVILPDDFVLNATESVGFRIKMTAPPVDLSDDQPEEVAKKYVFGVVKDANDYNTTSYYEAAATAEYAFNNAAFYSEKVDKNTHTPRYQCVTGNTVRVSEKQEGTFEIAKAFDQDQLEAGKIPDYYQNEEFTFTIFREKPDPTSSEGGTISERYVYREYTLWQKVGENWEQVDENKIHVTNAAGQLKLKANQKAVFKIPASFLYNNGETLTSRLKVVEEKSIFWEATQALTGSPGNGTLTVSNAYQSALYVEKELLNAPKSVTEQQKKEYEFTFRLLDKDGAPIANQPYQMVDKAIVGYTSPTILPMPEGNPGKTDENGEFKIHWGEVVAFTGLELGADYTVEELPLPENTDWVISKGSVTVNTTAAGNSAKLENRYRWKDLYLTKTLTRVDRLDLEKNPVTFRFLVEVQDADGNWVPFAGQKWVMTDKSHAVIYQSPGSDIPMQHGVTAADGTFTVTMNSATQYFKIMKLEEKQPYRIYELVDGNGDAVDKAGESTDFHALTQFQNGTMPVYAEGKEAVFKNEYLLRPIQVKKQVASSVSSDLNRFFRMKIEVGEAGGTLSPYADKTYQVYDERGKLVLPSGSTEFRTNAQGEFSIKHNWTVVFDDVGRAGKIDYRITELLDPSDSLKQLLPVNDKPAEGTLLDSGSVASFVNGSDGVILLGKEFSPKNEEAQKLVDLLSDPASVQLLTDDEKEQFQITLTFSSSITAQKVDTLGLTEPEPRQNSAVWTLYPWERLIIDTKDLTAGLTYTARESAADMEWYSFYEGEETVLDGLFISVKAETPSVSFQKGDGGLKLLVNELDAHRRSSVIRKKISPEHADFAKHPVLPGALLTMRVERWDGTRWTPAAGITYVARNEAEDNAMLPGETSTAAAQTTGEDGLLTVRKSDTEALWPAVYFDDEVHIIHDSTAAPEVGTLRIVEVPELSDSSWGRLVRYESAEAATSANIPQGTFFNSNAPGELFLTKDVMGEVDPKVDFTFVLAQVMNYTGTLGEESFAILDTASGSGIPYTVYDEKGNVVGSGETNAKGELRLKGDQTAKFSLPEGTVWTVSELQNTRYKLDSIDESTGVYKLQDNMVVVEIEASEKTDELLEITSVAWKPVPQDYTNKQWFNQQEGFAPGDALKFSDLAVQGIFTSGGKMLTVADITGMTVSGVAAEPVIDPETGEIIDYMWVCPVREADGANVTSDLQSRYVTLTYLVDGEEKQSDSLEIKLLPRGTGIPDTLSVPVCYVNDAVAAATAYNKGAAVDAGTLGYTELSNDLATFKYSNAQPLRVYPRVFKDSDGGYHYLAFNASNGATLILPAYNGENSVALIPETVNIQYGKNYPKSKALGVYSFYGDAVTVTAEEGAVVYTNEQKLKFFNPKNGTGEQKVFDAAVTDVWLPDWNVDANFKMTNAIDSFLGGCTSDILIVHCNQDTMNYLVNTGFKVRAGSKIIDETSIIKEESTTQEGTVKTNYRAFKIMSRKLTLLGYNVTAATGNLYFVVYDKDPRTNPDVQLVTPKKAGGTPDVSIYGLTK